MAAKRKTPARKRAPRKRPEPSVPIHAHKHHWTPSEREAMLITACGILAIAMVLLTVLAMSHGARCRQVAALPPVSVDVHIAERTVNGHLDPCTVRVWRPGTMECVI